MRWLLVLVCVLAVEGVAAAEGLDLESELVFVDASDRGLDVGDVGLWRTRAAVNVAERVRVAARLGLLVKQPGDESFLQTAGLEGRMRLTDRLALSLAAEYGALQGGKLAALELGLHGALDVGTYVRLAGRVGGEATRLFYDEEGDDRYFFAEAVGGGEARVCWGPCAGARGESWVAGELGVPVYHHPEGYDDVVYLGLDPGLRYDVTVGSVVHLTPRWDVFAEVAWIDRGDSIHPETELPRLDGGFDQLQVGVGVIAHL